MFLNIEHYFFCIEVSLYDKGSWQKQLFNIVSWVFFPLLAAVIRMYETNIVLLKLTPKYM